MLAAWTWLQIHYVVKSSCKLELIVDAIRALLCLVD